MFKHLFTNPRTFTTRLFLTISLGGGLILLALSSSRQPALHATASAGNSFAGEGCHQRVGQKEGANPTNRPQLQGAEARKYLQQPGEGQSLMQAIMAARFALKSQERGPFGEAGAGYLGMSHEQNLNAWFADDGVTVRPTVAEEERESSWHMDMRLKAYGYGKNLVAAPPIVSRQVKGNRIEYERSDCQLPTANCRFEDTTRSLLGSPQSSSEGFRKPQFASNKLFQSAIGGRQSAITEWYENRAEGIEQGFTIGARPARKDTVGLDEPLRLVVSLSGDLRAQVKDEGQAIELTEASGKRAVSYSKLTALDAAGKQLPARMETSADGSEIALLVDDRGASYPIVIDPIVERLVKIVDAGTLREVGAGFGDAVAVDDIRQDGTDIGFAIVGAWLEDTGGLDNGVVYFFTRTASTWDLNGQFFLASTTQTGERCGYSVAVNNLVDSGPFTGLFEGAAFGCPGVNSNTGKAFQWSYAARSAAELVPAAGTRNAGDYFGASVALDLHYAVVGAPRHDIPSISDAGAIHIISLGPVNTDRRYFGPAIANARLGSGVAIEGNTIVAGIPGEGFGRVDVYTKDSNNDWNPLATKLAAGNGQAGDLFGESLALSDDTLVISAAGDDSRGTDAGAAYVFVRGINGLWSQQQKLTASDGRADDIFSYYAVAIEGNTIAVGARRNDGVSSNPNDNRGAAYIFTRNGGVWTQDTKLGPSVLFGAPGDEFGSSVSISGATAIVSAPHGAAPSDGTPNAGVVYAYGLNCSPAYHSAAKFYPTTVGVSQLTLCPSESVLMQVTYVGGSGDPLRFQWRKDGINIPGATGTVYRIPSVSGSDAGSYDVSVSNSCGGEISRLATLIVRSFNINPSSQNLGVSGSSGVISVTLMGNCTTSVWAAVSNSPFINITSGASGIGNGTVGFNVAANPNAAQRTGTITAAGKTFTVTQDGTGGTLVSNVQFSAINYSAGEGSNNATITVTRTGDTSGTATVDFATSDLVAQQRTDYTIAAGTLSFAPGQMSKTFDVLLVDDNYVEGSETLNLTLSNPTGGAVLGVPGSAILTITDNDTISPTTNPLDNADQQFFVRQHFYDFLSRLPDQGGFDFWVGQITQCGSNQTCLRSKRLDVSNAFFFELEYQQTGAYVFRLYRAAFGNNQPFPNGDNSNQTEARKLPSYAVFARDRARVVGGANLAQGQLNLANVLVQRPEFLSKYPASQDGPAFVDAVLATIRNDTGADVGSQRAGLISLFNSGGRGAVMYRLADDNLATNPINNRAFIDAEYNRAFVATQYFGYLRRDSDIGGFLFWLGQVNSGPLRDATKQRAMVCAFTTSGEYQQRFSSVVTHSNAECQ